MDLYQHTVWFEYYLGLRRNGWSKKAAADAAHVYLRGLTPRKFKEAFREAFNACEVRQGRTATL